jgi:hypothetical protein
MEFIDKYTGARTHRMNTRCTDAQRVSECERERDVHRHAEIRRRQTHKRTQILETQNKHSAQKRVHQDQLTKDRSVHTGIDICTFLKRRGR